MNIFNCSVPEFYSLRNIPKFTDILQLVGTKVTEITEEFIENVMKVSHLKMMNLQNNQIQRIHHKIQNLTNVDKISLSGNPIHCDCDMTWMIPWLHRVPDDNETNIVDDFKDVKCGNGRFDGLPIYVLSDVNLGCYPKVYVYQLKPWQKGLIGAGVIVILLIMIFGAIAMNRSHEVKFFMFYSLKWDTVPKDDKNEKLQGVEYDAFFCYW